MPTYIASVIRDVLHNGDFAEFKSSVWGRRAFEGELGPYLLQLRRVIVNYRQMRLMTSNGLVFTYENLPKYNYS